MMAFLQYSPTEFVEFVKKNKAQTTGKSCDEIVAAVVPGVGALADRQAIKKTILASSSPEQLKGIVANYKELIGGQLNGLETQYKAGTGRNDFKSRYLTSAAVQGLTPPSAGGGAGDVDTSNPYLK